TAYVKSCHDPQRKGFTYQPRSSAVSFSRNASGTCALLLLGAADAADYAKIIESVQNAFNERYYFWYGHYYVGLTMNHLGGKEAEAWQRRLTEHLLGRQQPNGTWALPDSSTPGPVYQTSIAVVLLSAPAQNLPLLRK